MGTDLDISEVVAIAHQIAEADHSWAESQRVELGDLAWTPHLLREGAEAAVLHVHITGPLPSYVIKRMEAAKGLEYNIHVVLGLSQLYDDEMIRTLAALDAMVHLLGVSGEATVKPVSVLALLADKNVRVSEVLRRELARSGLQAVAAAQTSFHKGRRFEAVLAFLFSQTDDLLVVERNLRTDTEEIDAVLQQRSSAGRCWSTLGTAFLLLEAKYWADPVGKAPVSDFLLKLKGRRGTVRIGIMVAMSGFTSDARDHEMRFASENHTIVFVTMQDVESWIDAEDPDDFLETLVRRAMLR